MAGKLITLPFRVWLQSVRLLTRLAGEAAGRAVSLAGQTVGVSSPDRTPAAEPAVAVGEPRLEPTPPPAPPPARAPEAAASAPPPPPEPAPEEPAHVSEEPELVREEAEPGAEDGAGATVTVLEPWDGYARMNAREVIERAQEATPAELAAMRLYEAQHRSRQTVLAAIDRQLKLGNGGGPA